jgi:hypothetical protein
MIYIIITITYLSAWAHAERVACLHAALRGSSGRSEHFTYYTVVRHWDHTIAISAELSEVTILNAIDEFLRMFNAEASSYGLRFEMDSMMKQSMIQIASGMTNRQYDDTSIHNGSITQP